MMTPNIKDFAYYSDCFRHLHTNITKGYAAPHKPLLLLAIIDMIERGIITSPRIELSEALVSSFAEQANRYVGNSLVFKPDIGKPFYHMDYEPFWRLVPKNAVENIFTDGETATAAESAAAFGNKAVSGVGAKKKRVSYSVTSLRNQYAYALIDEELFNLLLNNDVRARLRTVLISTYLLRQPSLLRGKDLLPLIAAFITVIA